MTTPTVSRVQVNGASSHDTSAVERAGYCADGDHCERWHCRACGRYWLSDAKHHCDSAVHELEQTIRKWMEEAYAHYWVFSWCDPACQAFTSHSPA